MKKSLIAIAALAAVGVASAQSSVTLYGLADAGLKYEKIGSKKQYGSENGHLNGSRLGVKGSEDLGNGLKAVFNYELGFNSINGQFGNNAGFTRRAVVGFSGDFGTVLIGRDYTPVYNLASAVATDGLTDSEPLNNINVGGQRVNALTTRVDGIHFTGSYSGVGVMAFASANSTKNTGYENKGRGYGLALTYGNGPWVVGAGIQQFKDNDSVNSGLSSTVSSAVPGLTFTKTTEMALGGLYKFPAATVFAAVAQAKGEVAATKVTGQQAAVGVTVPVGAASFVAEYARGRVKVNSGKYHSSNNFMVGANYAFSKRTDVYVRAYSQGDTNLFDAPKKQNIRGAAVGLRHRF